MTASPRVLFSTIPDPAPILDRWAATDQMAYRLTRGQGVFTLEEHAHAWPLHLIAQNIDSPSVLLEWPTWEGFEAELARHRYDYVCISFMNRDIDKLGEMSRIIRRLQPDAQIVVGGYGVICLPDGKELDYAPDVDHICRVEGVSFMRELLGERVGAPVTCRLPQSGAGLPWLTKRQRGSIGAVLASLGCTKRCPFCATSFYTRGARNQVLDETGLFNAMKGYWASNPFTSSVNIYDENYLDYEDRVRALGKLIREDTEYGLEHLNWFTFGSVSAICKYSPEELLLCGLDTVWVGVESLFTNLKKARISDTTWGDPTRRDVTDVTAVFRALHGAGIKTIGSWIAGLDVQTHANIARDVAYFVSLGATFQQVSILTVEPEMPWARNFKTRTADGKRYPWDNYHLYGETFEARNIPHNELLAVVERVYQQLNEEHGPSAMRVLRTNLNGYRTCINSSHELLRTAKAAFFQRRVRAYTPLLKAARAMAPSARVAEGLRDLETEIVELLGPFSPEHERYAERLLRLAEAEQARLNGGERPIKTDGFRRYRYADGDQRPPAPRKPYDVEHVLIRAPIARRAPQRTPHVDPEQRLSTES